MLEFLDGYKTYLGVIGWTVIQMLMTAMPEHMAVWVVLETLCTGLTGVGVAHKLDKVAR